MQTQIQQFLAKYYPNTHIKNLTKLSGGGGKRTYYQFTHNQNNVVLTTNQNQAENRAFFYFSSILKQLNNPVPEIFHISTNQKIYTQSHLGTQTLLDYHLQNPTESIIYYKKAVKSLAQLQVSAHQIVDYKQCYDFDSFDSMLVLRDLFYCKHHFLDYFDLDYPQKQLFIEFQCLAMRIQNIPEQFFMYRDFQARNIMLQNNQIYFIDYQAGMKGPMQYDLVSLLWQAKAKLTATQKEELYQYYLESVQQLHPKLNLESFANGYHLCLLARLLQVLGAYGRLGLQQKKSHFVQSIDLALQNLKLVSNQAFASNFPIIKQIMQQLQKEQIQQKIQQILES